MFTSTLQTAELQKAIRSADVLICAVHAKFHQSPVLITEEMVASMKQGSVIVDVSIDQGGCVETSRITSHDKPVFNVHGVTHYCVTNIASRFPNTASIALSNFLLQCLLKPVNWAVLKNYYYMIYTFGKDFIPIMVFD